MSNTFKYIPNRRFNWFSHYKHIGYKKCEATVIDHLKDSDIVICSNRLKSTCSRIPSPWSSDKIIASRKMKPKKVSLRDYIKKQKKLKQRKKI